MSTKPYLSMPQRVMALVGIAVMIVYSLGNFKPIVDGHGGVIATGLIFAIVLTIVVTGQMKTKQEESSTKRRFRVYDGGRS